MKNTGIALILMIFLVLMCSLVALTAFSLLATGEKNSGDWAASVQALAIASGGKEWYLEKLQNDTDWSNETNQTNIALGGGTFDVTIKSAAFGSVSFVITGNVAGMLGQTVRRQTAITAKRLPTASHFAVFWGNDAGNFDIGTATTINGDFWSAGTMDVKTGCSVTGTTYCPTTEDVTGVGTFTKVKITAPNPAMPQIDRTFYDNLISVWNIYIATYSTGVDATLSANLNMTGGVYAYRNLTTTGNITISGRGYIVATQDIDLHALASSSGTLTITPSGGNIYILAARNLTVNSTANDTNVIINGDANNKVYLYSQDSSTARLVRIRKAPATTTTVNSAVIVGGRRIIVEAGAQVTNSTIYVNDVTDTNNYLQITDPGTNVGVAGKPCSVLSVSGATPGLKINNNASVTGFVYHYGGTTGTTQINGNSVVTGSVVASQFESDRIAGATITYSKAALPSAANGFEAFVSTDVESWDDR